MTTVTGLTAARMLEIEAASIVDGEVVGDDLILTKHDNSTINAGSVRGPEGPVGPESSSAFLGQQGILNPGDAVLTRNSAVQVTIEAGTGWVKLASGVLKRVTWVQTILPVRNPATSALDQVVVDENGVVSIQEGAVQAGVTLQNRTGVDDSGIHAGKLRLYDLRPNNAAGGVALADIRDRRGWARGFNKKITRNQNASGGVNYACASGSWISVDAANIDHNFETISGEIEIILSGYRWGNGMNTAYMAQRILRLQDAGSIDKATNTNTGQVDAASKDAFAARFTEHWNVLLNPGTYTYQLQWANNAANISLGADVGLPLSLTVREIVRQNANN